MDERELDLAAFSCISAQAQLSFESPVAIAWEESPFAWIRLEPSRRKGAIGEELVREWARQEGITVEGALNTGHDCRLDGLAVEVKLSLLWASGQFVFQQIRDQDYDVACLLGIESHRVHLWVVPKELLWKKSKWQHTGAGGRDTKWLRFQADNPEPWLASRGDTLGKAKRVLLKEARS